MNTAAILKSVLAGGLTLGLTTVASAAAMQSKTMSMSNMEKCYGINAAHKNNCKTPGHSCAGQDTKARDPNSFVAVPKGLCEKIDGGKLEPAQKG
ncbi:MULTISPECIES: BufA1 family periplasmic bufferin-type metallophore [Rhodanobacter]|uniref:BufA1 family periplasmic bufferin-type metallophore n=1 Tax=Rhodanobacter TaxID=75309 RepID=UPI000484A6D8|nr:MULTISPECIES: DUF2282 domain-containing protein [Rhodanobacter]KZC30819.1 hypothetical protein RhoFW510R10_00960 [Rhodanobacter sp. FW510-R10]UJM95500.1 DUF2282 domain-containing protein [Rhodanobacter denitrificans]UJM99031.1 DUF2282 domain-containing protein [Rhodanobacter denitrificans]UJN21554.1 DUF2282 domain-containing protein [Rhodanobacter denitrificans]